ncbi:MAG: GcrA family cell cycle regulator [Janthinobacterium lividum]
MDWNEDTIARLRAFWDEGHSTAEIGRRMGVTKNAIVGKAHRLELPARPSPIRRVAEAGHVSRRDQVRRVSGPTLPVAEAVADAVRKEPLAEPPSVARPAPLLRAVPPPRPAVKASTCCWPIGEPGTPSFRFCDEGALPSKPYCQEHASLAYVKVRDRREDAA